MRDIRDFAEIFQIAKRGGGDLRGIITNTADIIGDKQEIRREIEMVVSEKRFEQQIMRFIPFLLSSISHSQQRGILRACIIIYLDGAS